MDHSFEDFSLQGREKCVFSRLFPSHYDCHRNTIEAQFPAFDLWPEGLLGVSRTAPGAGIA